MLLGLVAGGLSHAANNSVQGAKKEEGGIDIDAPTAILIEAKSGSVLFEKNADQPVAPSSMLKLMTAEFVFNALRKGDIKGSDQYVVSENAWRRGGAPAGGPTMFAAIHSRVGIDDLLRGMIIDNGNDSAMVLAEGMAGNEREFAAMLTKRAREIGLEQSTFANATGMSDPGNKMSVRDIAKLARHVIQTYPDYYKLYNEREFIWNKIRQQNRNPLLNAMSGSDGLIAGSTKDGGYGAVTSAVQDGLRLIVVVNGLDDPDDRVTEAKKLLDWGFRSFELRTLFEPERVVGYAKVFGGSSGSVALASIAEGCNQCDHVARGMENRVGVDGGRRAGAPEAAHVRGNHMKAGIGQGAQLMPPGVGQFRPPMAKQHQRPAPALADEHVDPVDCEHACG